MAAIKVNGIVTRYVNYKESDRILTLYTLEQGLVSCAARRARRPNSPLMGASELFVCGEYVLFKAGDKLNVDSVELTQRHYPIREDIDKFSAASYITSIVNVGAEEHKNAELYRLLKYALAYLAYGESEPVDIAICFTLKALAYLGYRAAVTHCALCGEDIRGYKRADFSSGGGALCKNCGKGAGDMQLDALSLEAMRRMLLIDDKDINKVKLPSEVRQQLKKAANLFAAHTLEHNFKAMDFCC